MKLYTFILLLLPTIILSQNKLTKDLDGDTVLDTIYIDYNTSKIVCKLSSTNFKKIESKEIEMLADTSSIREAKNGFIFSTDWMRAGYENQFRYNKKTIKNTFNRYEQI